MTKISKTVIFIGFGLVMFMLGMGLGIRVANDNWKESLQNYAFEK